MPVSIRQLGWLLFIIIIINNTLTTTTTYLKKYVNLIFIK